VIFENLEIISLWIGLIGIITLLKKPSLIFLLFGLELVFLSINLIFIQASINHDSIQGHVISLILFALAAVDASIGLIIILDYYNLNVVLFEVPEGLIKG
jgi:NADH:ubiquinone oxidoreductase subunit K